MSDRTMLWVARGWDTEGMPPLRRTLATAAAAVALVAVAAPTGAGDPGAPEHPAPAATPTPDAGWQDDCRTALLVGQDVIDAMEVPPPVGWEVAMQCGPSAEDRNAYARNSTQQIVLFVQRAASREALTFTLWHETGHAYDREYLGSASKDRWREARSMPSEHVLPWRGADEWAMSPAEDWAEAYAHCHYPDTGRWATELAGPPTDAKCELLRYLVNPWAAPTFWGA